MLLEDRVEPMTRAIIHALAATGAAPSRWDGYQESEDLIPLKRRYNDAVEFSRASNYSARVRLWGIREREPVPSSIIIHPTMVLEEKERATAEVTIDNFNSSQPSEPYIWMKEFNTGQSEEAAISATAESETWGEAKVSGGVGVAEAEASVGFRLKLTAAWSQQTGKHRDEKTGGTFALRAAPHSKITGFLQWNEQTLQRRLQYASRIDAIIEIGRFHSKSNKWASRSPVKWDSIDHLLAVMEKRGRVEHAGYEHYSRRNDANMAALIDNIQSKRLIPIDRLTDPFSGADGIRVVISEVLDREDEDEDD